MSDCNLACATPESLGISSGAVAEFLGALIEKRLCMHGFLLIRHGRIAAEGYWPPFDKDRKHRMYSVSKSFTSVAIGMLIDEGKLSLDTKPSDIFPEYLPSNPHRYVLEATVRDLLTMSTYNLGTSYSDKSPDFTETFFTDSGPKHKPGQIFSYDTAATTVLCAIVEKLSGKRMLEYMRPVLDEIGFSGDAWCVETPEGRSWTGSGIICTPRDFARFALLCMNLGEWNGKQLVSREYMSAATTKQIDNFVNGGEPERVHGYGYQIWCLKDGGFAMFGMGSQFAFCMPKYDAVLITTADTQGISGARDIILDAYMRLLEGCADGPVDEDPAALAELNGIIAGLSMPVPEGKATTPLAGSISGKTYVLEENTAGMKWLRLVIGDDVCRLEYENATGEHSLALGMGWYKTQTFPEKYYGKRIGRRDTQYEAIGAGAWACDNALVGLIYSVDDYLGSISLQLTFEDGEVCGYMKKAAEWFFDEYQGYLTGKEE